MSTSIPITSISHILPSSPTMSTASSFDMLSCRSRSSTASSASAELDLDASDEEVIVWSVSDESSLSSESGLSPDPASDDDFVVLSRPRSPTRSRAPILPPTDNTLASDLARLSVNEVSATIRRNKRAAAAATKQANVSPPSSPKGSRNRKRTRSPPAQSQPLSPIPTAPAAERPSSVATLTGKPGGRRRRKGAKSASSSPRGLGARSIVDDVSELADTVSERDVDDSEPALSMYDAAASYINAFLADKSSVARLTLLQSLIIELGLASAALPASLSAAKATLKSHAFLNVGEYLAVRQQGPAAVQSVMHKSRASLIRDIRRKRNPASLQWVKEAGLQVLLVSCRY